MPVAASRPRAELPDRQKQNIFQFDESGGDVGFLEFGASDVRSGSEMEVWGGDGASFPGMPLIRDDLFAFVVQQRVYITDRFDLPGDSRIFLLHYLSEMAKPQSDVNAGQADRITIPENQRMFGTRPVSRALNRDDGLGDA